MLPSGLISDINTELVAAAKTCDTIDPPLAATWWRVKSIIELLNALDELIYFFNKYSNVLKIRFYIYIVYAFKIHNIKRLKRVSDAVNNHRLELNEILKNLKQKKNKIAAVGAPAKGMTLLNFCNIDNNLLEFVTEVST